VFTKTKGKKAVNYYAFHVGDYAAHTRHLSLMEDLCYRRMLDMYYMIEGPLPAAAIVARKTGMELQIVETILEEFFEQTESGMWRSKRADAEIEVYAQKTARAEKAAVARWGSKASKPSEHSKQNAGAQRPYCASNAGATDEQSQSNAGATDEQSQSNADAMQMHCTSNAGALSKHCQPITNNQSNTPSASQSPPAGGAAVAAEPVRKARKRRLPADWAPTEAHRGLAQKQGKNLDRELEQFRDHHRAKGSEFFDWDAALNTWLRRDFTTNTTQKHDQREQRKAREFPEEIHLKSVDLRGIAGEGPDGVGAIEQRGRVGRDFGAQQIAETPSVAQNDSRPLLAGGGGAGAVVHPDGIPNGLAWASGRRENAVGHVDCVGGGAIGAATGLSHGQRIATRDELSVL
jgi:uncharacterized protein YdaU (DUF1376 family)